jgi:hypothetical protein
MVQEVEKYLSDPFPGHPQSVASHFKEMENGNAQ